MLIESEELFKIILEKGMLAIVVLFAAFLLNQILQRQKLRAEAANEIATERCEAYIELWKRIAEIRPKRKEELTEERVAELLSFLDSWYHNEANALYMSWKTTEAYFYLLRFLKIRSVSCVI